MTISEKTIEQWMALPDFETLKGVMLPVLATLTDDELLGLFRRVQVMHNAWQGQFAPCPPIQIHAITYQALASRGI